MSETRLELQLAALLVTLFLALNLVSAEAAHNMSAEALTVLSHNLHAEVDHLEPMLDVLRESDADLIALQEISDVAYERFVADLDYPYSVADVSEGRYNGMALFSHYEILDSQSFDEMRLLRVQVDVAGTVVTVYNVHPVSPGTTGMDREPRSQQIAWLLDRIDAESGPVLLLGDFNMEEWSPDYDAITATFVDPFRELYPDASGFTYPDYSLPQAQVNARLPIWSPPVLRLDYIFHNPALTYLDAGVVDQASGSDHRAVWAQVALN